MPACALTRSKASSSLFHRRARVKACERFVNLSTPPFSESIVRRCRTSPNECVGRCSSFTQIQLWPLPRRPFSHDTPSMQPGMTCMARNFKKWCQATLSQKTSKAQQIRGCRTQPNIYTACAKRGTYVGQYARPRHAYVLSTMVWMVLSDSKLSTSNFPYQTSDSKLSTSNFPYQTYDRKLSI